MRDQSQTGGGRWLKSCILEKLRTWTVSNPWQGGIKGKQSLKGRERPDASPRVEGHRREGWPE